MTQTDKQNILTNLLRFLERSVSVGQPSVGKLALIQIGPWTKILNKSVKFVQKCIEQVSQKFIS